MEISLFMLDVKKLNLKKVKEFDPEKRFQEITPLIETKSEYLKILDKLEQLLAELDRFDTETEFFKNYGFKNDWVPIMYYIENGKGKFTDLEFGNIYDAIKQWSAEDFLSTDLALLNFKYELFEQNDNPSISNKIVKITPLGENEKYELWLWFEKDDLTDLKFKD